MIHLQIWTTNKLIKMKQFKNGIFQLTQFEFDNKITSHLLHLGNTVMRIVTEEKRRHVCTVTEKELPHFKVLHVFICRHTIIRFLL